MRNHRSRSGDLWIGYVVGPDTEPPPGVTNLGGSFIDSRSKRQFFAALLPHHVLGGLLSCLDNQYDAPLTG